MPDAERVVKKALEYSDLPDADVAEYYDAATGRNVIKVWYRLNLEKYGIEMAYDPSAPRSVIEREVETMVRRLEEQMYQSGATVNYKGATYLIRWKQQDYIEVECTSCHAGQFIPFKSRDNNPAWQRDVAICYLLGEMNCGCQDLSKKLDRKI